MKVNFFTASEYKIADAAREMSLRALRTLERAMTWLPVGAQYYIGA